MKTKAAIPTTNASRYLQQLCKHWSHRFNVSFDSANGLIPFDADRNCALEATDAHLLLTVEAPDAEGATRLQSVVFDHLKRFAFRETLEAPAWAPA